MIVTAEGLRSVKTFTINGKVEVMKFFRPQVGISHIVIREEGVKHFVPLLSRGWRRIACSS
jgi:hypothetical protein